MSKKAKDLDKFYTHPDIAKTFVDKINEMFPLNQYDMVIEPSAGSGNILQYLPTNSIGLDLEPEGDNIVKQDFFKYDPGYHPLINNIRIAAVGNPPFGRQSSIARKFIKHICSCNKTRSISFILPKSFKKDASFLSLPRAQSGQGF